MAASPSAVRPHFAVFPALAAIFAIGLLCAGEGSAKPPVGDVPGQVVRMDESPISLERRALREALKAEQVAEANKGFDGRAVGQLISILGNDRGGAADGGGIRTPRWRGRSA